MVNRWGLNYGIISPFILRVIIIPTTKKTLSPFFNSWEEQEMEMLSYYQIFHFDSFHTEEGSSCVGGAVPLPYLGALSIFPGPGSARPSPGRFYVDVWSPSVI